MLDQKHPGNPPESHPAHGEPAHADPAEWVRFRADHPDLAYLDVVFPDLHGRLRGKRLRAAEAEKIFKTGVQIPVGLQFLDITGDCLYPLGLGQDDGDPDGNGFPVAGSLMRLPWAPAPTAQILMEMHGLGGGPADSDPRVICRRVIDRVHALGVRPVVAIELEFYLIDGERDAAGHPQPAISPVTGRRAATAQVYGMRELDAFHPFFGALDRACATIGVPASVATTEFAPGQFEVNLRHVDRPLAAADHALLLRQAVEGVAHHLGMQATFLSKPFIEQTGSGMHIHLSLLDDSGRNLFAEPPGAEPSTAPTLRHAIGGMLATMAEGMAVWAPNINAYRRFGPNWYVPVTPSWDYNNRSVAMRIPAGPPEARRIEHRVAGADANPYLALACVLAGLHHGLTHEIDPGPSAAGGNACTAVDPDLPMTWRLALDRLERAEILRDYLGDWYTTLYVAANRLELEKFQAIVAPHEFEWYL